MDHISNEAMRAYLLGLLPDDEATALEQEYFVNRAFFLKVQAAETALIVDYLNGKLQPAEKRGFEKRYLCVPNLRSKVDEVRRQYEASRPAERPPLWAGWRVAFATLLALVAGLGVWTYYFTQNKPDKLASNAPVSPSPHHITPPAGTPLFIYLSPGLTKGGGVGSKLVEFPQLAADSTLNMILELSGQLSPVKRAVEILIEKPDGSFASVWNSSQPVLSVRSDRPNLSPVPTSIGATRPELTSQVISLSLPGSLFLPGDYMVKISTVDGKRHDDYFYRVLTPR